MEKYPAIKSCALAGYLMTWKVEMNKKDADLSRCGKLFWLGTEKPRKKELEVNNYSVKLFLMGIWVSNCELASHAYWGWSMNKWMLHGFQRISNCGIGKLEISKVGGWDYNEQCGTRLESEISV